MQIIYPGYVSGRCLPDEAFSEEYHHAQQQGIRCLLLDQEAAAAGRYRFSAAIEASSPVIWRGWMLTAAEYDGLYRAVAQCGGHMRVTPEQYLSNHHITGWYECCREFTAETVFTTPEADFETLTAQLQWPGYFVKDYVKSLTTSRGSLAADAAGIRDVIRLIAHYRGDIEGGICLRKREDYIPHSERRCFVLKGRIGSAEGEIPEIVRSIAARITAPFYSVDIAADRHGEWRLVEIGDGQVSDCKEWDVARFVRMLCGDRFC